MSSNFSFPQKSAPCETADQVLVLQYFITRIPLGSPERLTAIRDLANSAFQLCMIICLPCQTTSTNILSFRILHLDVIFTEHQIIAFMDRSIHFKTMEVLRPVDQRLEAMLLAGDCGVIAYQILTHATFWGRQKMVSWCGCSLKSGQMPQHQVHSLQLHSDTANRNTPFLLFTKAPLSNKRNICGESLQQV